MDPDDAIRATALFRRFRERGDPAALTGVFDLAAPELLAVASHLVRDPAAAEDLVQDTFLVAIRKARRFDPRRPVLPWLLGILVRVASKHRRRAGRHLDADRVHSAAAPEASRAALDGELRAALDAALAELPPRYGEVVRAHLEGGEAPRDIAARLGRAPGTVRVQLHRGLELLRRVLPPGLALGALGTTGTRGLSAVRELVEREALVRGPALAASGAGVLSLPALPKIGVLAVGSKTIVAAGIVAVSGLGALLLRAEREAPLDAERPVAPRVVRAELSAPAIDHAPPPRAARAAEGGPVEENPAPLPAPPAPPPAAGALVRGRITGTTTAPDGGFQLTVQVGETPPRQKTVPVAGEGPYSVPLDDLVGDGDPRSLGVLVVLRAEGYVPTSSWARADESSAAGAVEYVADLEAHPIVRTLRGSARFEDRAPPGRPWVAFLPDGMEPPLDWQPVPECHLDGRGDFRLDLHDARPGALIVVAEGLSVAHVAIAADDLGVVDLGTIELAEGATIEGRALRDGVPLVAGSIVRATLEYRPSPWTLATRDTILLAPAKAVHRSVEAAVEDGGRFRLTGLESGVEYGLVAVPADGRRGFLSLGSPGTRVTAPASGVELDWGLAPVQVRVQWRESPVTDANVSPRHADSDPRAGLPAVIRGDWDQRVDGGPDGTVSLLLPRDCATRLEVAAPGFETRSVTVDPRDMDGGAGGDARELVVELERLGAPPSLTLRFVYDGPGTLEGTMVFLTLLGAAGMERARPAFVREGEARFPALPAGDFRGHVTLHVPQAVAFDDLPTPELPSHGIDLSGLAAGATLERVIEVGVGGRIELHLVGRDPALPHPEFELVEATGNVVRPMLIRRDPRGHDTARVIDTDGPYLLGRSLYPGTFTVRQVGAAYRADEQEVLVRAGESTVVTFQLEPR